MKKYFFLILFIGITFCNSLYSQWAPVGAKWYYEHYSGAQSYLTVIESIKDTTILNKKCKVLKSYNIYINQYLKPDNTIYSYWDTLYCPSQYTYYDSSKVFLFDNIKNKFYKLYDYSAIKGDTITVRDSSFNGYCPIVIPAALFQYKIDSITSVSVGNISLKSQHVSITKNAGWSFYNPYFPLCNSVIEKIGSLQYLFGSVPDGIEGGLKCLRCYQDSSILFRSSYWQEPLPCDYLYPLSSTFEINADESNIKIFPNPSSHILNIQFPLLVKGTVIIYNAIGSKMETIDIEKSSMKVDISSWDKGIYFIQVLYNDISVTSKILKQ